MTALKRPVLLCDHVPALPGGECTTRYVGRLGEHPAETRKRAKAKGWDTFTTSADMNRIRVDYCPKHNTRGRR